MRFFVLLALCVGLAVSARADLFDVTDLRFAGDEQAAKQRAVETVVLRLIGQMEIPSELFEVLEQPEQWIVSWGVVDPTAGVAQFKVDPGIRQIISRLEYPVWTQPRQTPWLWMMVDEGDGRQPVTAPVTPKCCVSCGCWPTGLLWMFDCPNGTRVINKPSGSPNFGACSWTDWPVPASAIPETIRRFVSVRLGISGC